MAAHSLECLCGDWLAPARHSLPRFPGNYARIDDSARHFAGPHPFAILFFYYWGPTLFVTLACTPAAALLVRFNRLGYRAVALIVPLIVAAAILDPFPFLLSLLFLVPSGIAFFVALIVSVGRRRRREDANSSSRETLSLS